ncbi:MAG: non-homologous end-joining DNA ligase, partial [Propionibacteriaceae bacterium]|nr:non-homologous end-joining DNA ligase [Propionibacteriaceae bacterium]
MAAAGGRQVTVDGHPLALTNLDKVLYPATGTTKGEVIAYYAAIGAVLVPHLWQRPITRKRWPDGVGEDGDPPGVFFAKNLPKGTPDWVRRYTIEHSEGSNDYPIANDIATLVWLAQLAALELHVPQWRFTDDGTSLPPDRLVLDLDPGEGVSLAACAEVAGWVREVLDGAGLPSHPVTSGSKGIHLYARLDGSITTEDATNLARELAEALQAAHPDRVTAVMRRADRAGRVFLDWSQNNGNKTTIAPYSLRGRTRPWVAAPRTWEELADPDLRQLEFDEVLSRIADSGDLLAALASPEAVAALGDVRPSLADLSGEPGAPGPAAGPVATSP